MRGIGEDPDIVNFSDLIFLDLLPFLSFICADPDPGSQNVGIQRIRIQEAKMLRVQEAKMLRVQLIRIQEAKMLRVQRIRILSTSEIIFLCLPEHRSCD